VVVADIRWRWHHHPQTICWCFRQIVMRPVYKSSFFTYVYSYFSYLDILFRWATQPVSTTCL
jgi:hypothetical protein